jgi:hypothetical protein
VANRRFAISDPRERQRERQIQLRVDPTDHFVKKSIFSAEHLERARDPLGWILLFAVLKRKRDELFLFVAEGDGHSCRLGHRRSAEE